MDIKSISSAQCRAARALVGIQQSELATHANVSRSTVIDFETGKRIPGTNNLLAIRAALEAAGVEFLPENGGGEGVRMAKPARP